jgi:hypothetical protein
MVINGYRIINGIELYDPQKKAVAKKVSALSKEPGSSLLAKSEKDVMSIIDSGVTLVELENNTPRFIAAFMKTGHPDYVEIRMVCNLEPSNVGRVKGQFIFPLMVARYRERNGGDGSKMFFLTTTNARMVIVAARANFEEVRSVQKFFPADVLRFCCSICPPMKTGATELGEQLERCLRFKGDFIPTAGSIVNHHPCRVFSQHF